MKASQLHIPDPCTQDWKAMTGTGCRRHCGSCDKPVHHLSKMSQPEAEAVLGTGACVRFGVDAAGNVLFRKGRLARALAIATAAFVTLPALASGQPDHQPKEGIVERLANWATGVVAPQPVEELMGDIAMAMDRQVENKTSTTLDVKCEDGTAATLAPKQTWNTETYYGSCTATAMGRDLSTTWNDLAVHCTLGSDSLTCAPQE